LYGNDFVFLDRALDGLAKEHKVIPVQLALFAEMVKGRPWVPATLKQLGGITGVGVTFLEETFTSRTANPKHRVHQAAVRRVLSALLPGDDTNIRGRNRSYEELLEASGYTQRRSDFTELIQILDGETRLITPVELDDGQPEPALAADRSYQLTHDFLVPSLRDWLTRKQRATRRGRAELRLAERASTWQARPINRHLPAFWEFLTIRVLTRRNGWSAAQREMMRKAGKVYTARAVLLTLVVLLSAWGIFQARGRLRSEALVESLQRADTREVPQIVNEISRYRHWADPRLKELVKTSELGTKQRLHAGLALLPVDSSQMSSLCGSLLEATPDEFPVLRDALAKHKTELLQPLWDVLQSSEELATRRFLAACSLAAYDPDGDPTNSRGWTPVAPFVTRELVETIGRNQSDYAVWTFALDPIKDWLYEPLASIFRDQQRRASDRDLAVNILADYAADDPSELTELLMDADARQFAVLFAKLSRHGDTAMHQLQERLERTIMEDETGGAREQLAKRQAAAAVALLRLGRPEDVWPLLSHSPDPRQRTYLIHGLRPFGAEIDSLVGRLRDDPEVSIRRALILSLAPYVGELRPRQRDALRDRLLNAFRDDPDPGVHSAAEFLLRRLGFEDELLDARQSMATGRWSENRQWYVSGQGHTMAVLRGPVEFSMGSPEGEAFREEDEQLWTARIDDDFAIATTEVTVEQFRRFQPDFHHEEMDRSPDSNCPAVGILWYEAIAYCNWLSREEGIEEDELCYYYDDTDPRRVNAGTVPDFHGKTGYRLPTEVEWEFACRAGATTSRFYGQSDELLREYAWLQDTSQGRTWPVGLLMPNDFGLFDAFGNVFEWCQDRYEVHNMADSRTSGQSAPSVDRRRVMRGGSFVDGIPFARAANRYRQLPETRRAISGFRVARTIVRQ
jgi:formylglycine-generating enzyme required for sulfatase activity